MDGSAIATIVAAFAGLVTAFAGLILQLRRVDPENVKALRERAGKAEARVRELEPALLAAHALVFRLRLLLARNGIVDPEGAEPDDVDPAGVVSS